MVIYPNPFFNQIGIRKETFISQLKAFKKNNKQWNKSIHKHSFQSTRDVIETLLILNLKEETTRDPKYLESLIYLLPKEILIEIFEYLTIY